MTTKTVCISFDFATDELHVNVTIDDDDDWDGDEPDPGEEADDEPAREVVSLRAASG